MSSSPRANVLSERDPNIPQSPEKTKSGLKSNGQQQDAPKSLEFHRQALEARLKESKSVNNFSPSTSVNNARPTSQPNAALTSSSAASFGNIIDHLFIPHEVHKISRAHIVPSLSRDQQTYVSPSDNIMSPATAKLAAFKKRHVKRYVVLNGYMHAELDR